MTSLFKKKYIRVPHLSFMDSFREIGRNAFVDWIIVLIISSLISISLVIISSLLYIQITNGNFKGTKVKTISPPKVFDKNELSSIINSFKIKQDASIQIMKGYKGPTDPSI